jgi:hypothetical protein
VASALTPPLAVAAVVLCLAGLAKLRSPSEALGALSEIGLSVPVALVRAFAIFEIGLAGWWAARPGAVPAAVIACVYAGFACLALVFRRRRASCGCFGAHEAPASIVQSCISLALALVAGAGAIWPVHGVSWLVAEPVATVMVLTLGIAGAAYATVLAYTELPLAWSAWAGARLDRFS